MARPWTVLPHRPLEKLQSNLWSVEADLPRGPLKRRMGIARLGDGRLAFLNAIALEEAAMREIEAWGEPAFAVPGNGFHRLDLGSYKARYPKLQILATPQAGPRIASIAGVDGGLDRLPPDPAIRVEEVAGTRTGEPVAVCAAEGKVALCFPGDLLTNARAMPGVGGLLANLVGFVGELRVPRLIRLIGIRDKPAVRAHLLRLAALPGLSHVFGCHGPVVSQDASGALRQAAEAL